MDKLALPSADFYEEDADISSPTGTSVRAKSPDFKAEAPPSNPPAHKPEPPVITNDLKVTSSPAKKEASKRRPIEFPAEFVSSEPVVPAKDSNRSDDVSLSIALPISECLDAISNCKGQGPQIRSWPRCTPPFINLTALSTCDALVVPF